MYYGFIHKSKSELDYDKKLKKSLEDEFIVDPETGARLTLEQAESGNWIAHDNEFRTLSDSELELLLSEEEKQAEQAKNYLRESRNYRVIQLSPDQEALLEQTKMLGKYNTWSYSDCYRIEFSKAILVCVFIQDAHGGRESQIMVWVPLEGNHGHYYFREKSGTEKFFDLIRDDDEIKLEGYECFCFDRKKTNLALMRQLNKFQGQKGLEIEFKNDNLFFKTRRALELNDLYWLEEIIKKF